MLRLDWTGSIVGAIHLSGPIAKVSKGLCKLCLAHCGLTAKGVNQIAHSLSLNGNISNSLTYMDLSSNNFKDDITVRIYNYYNSIIIDNFIIILYTIFECWFCFLFL